MDKSTSIYEHEIWDSEKLKSFYALKDLINGRLQESGQSLLTQMNSTYLHIWAIKCLSQNNHKRVAKELSKELLRVSQLEDDEFLFEFRHHPTPDDEDWYDYAVEIGYDDSDNWQTKYI